MVEIIGNFIRRTGNRRKHSSVLRRGLGLEERRNKELSYENNIRNIINKDSDKSLSHSATGAASTQQATCTSPSGPCNNI